MRDVLQLNDAQTDAEWTVYKTHHLDGYLASLTDDKLQKYIDGANAINALYYPTYDPTSG